MVPLWSNLKVALQAYFADKLIIKQRGSFSFEKHKNSSEAEFNEFEPRLKFGWFQLKLYSIFQDFSRRSIKTGFLGIWDAALNL